MTHQHAQPIREAVGIFVESDRLESAIDGLLSAGFERSLDDPEAPRIAFVRDESLGDTLHAWVGSLFFTGATAAGGAAVASAAVLGGGLVAAATGVAAVAAVGTVLSLLMLQKDAEYLEQQVDEGHVLLFVRVLDTESERRAVEILAKHSNFDVKVCTVADVAPQAAAAAKS